MTIDGEILFSEQDIRDRVQELAADIARDYAGRDVVLICILKGALLFTADLMRALDLPVTIAFVQAASYGDGTSSQTVLLKKDCDMDVAGRHLLLVDTIIDTGKTLDFLRKKFEERSPASLNAAVLLDKRSRREVEVPIAYRGFEIPDRFVVGYGMDRGEKCRNLPYIAAID